MDTISPKPITATKGTKAGKKTKTTVPGKIKKQIGVIVSNDSKVVLLSARKVYGEHSSTHFLIERLVV
jgi:hypothetical protein